jgi:hypothetical protein
MVNDYSKFWQASNDAVLYCNGDSFTWGTGLGNLECPPQINFDRFEKSRLNNSWPGQLSQIINCDFINDAWAGGSNARMIRRTKKFISEIESCLNVTVVLGWTTAGRTEYSRPLHEIDTQIPYRRQGRTGKYDIDDGTTYVQMQADGLGSKYDPVLQDDVDYQKKFFVENTDADLFVAYMEQIIDIQNFLKEYKIQYLFFNAFGNKELYKENLDDMRIYPLLDQIDFDRFMGWPDEDFCVWSYMEFGNDKLKDGHLGVASHKHLAVLLNNKLKELYG